MVDFHRVLLSDRGWLEPILRADVDRGCEYTFGNIFIWSAVSDINVASFEGGALIHFERNPNCYLFPVGELDVKAAFERLFCDCVERGCECCVIAASKEDCELIERIFPNEFNFHETRHFAEYVYASSDLIELAGKKYHGKRNHISRFERDNSYSFHEITGESDIERLLEFNEGWFRAQESADEGLQNEHLAATSALKNFFSLGFKGGYIETASDGIVAFSLGEPINDKTFCVHIEKARADIAGAYTVINRDFAAAFCKDYEYINREDDAGEEGLRKAKLSYYPAFLKEKFVITKRS